MNKKIETMPPDQIAAKGRELIKLAKKKETELRQRQLLQIGEIFRREIHSNWSTPRDVLLAELEPILGTPVVLPNWLQQHNIEAKEDTRYGSQLSSM